RLPGSQIVSARNTKQWEPPGFNVVQCGGL
ncbi:MAG: hypothetical protein ACI9GK_001458, partial [Devosia sp.]